MVPYFLVTRIGLETHLVYSMVYINLACQNMLSFDIMVGALARCIVHCFWWIGGALGHVSL